MTEQFNISELMKLTNVNPRAEKHGEEDVLAVDLSVKATFDVDDIKLLMPSVDMAALKKTFWDKDGHPFAEHHLALVTELKEYRVTVSKPGNKNHLLFGETSTVKGFKIEFNHGTTVNLSFKIQCNCDGNSIGKLSECLNEDISVEIESGPQGEMDLE